MRGAASARTGGRRTGRALGYRMPAEWAPHEATWLAWPHHRTDWPGKLAVIPWVFAEIAKHLSRGERVRLLVASAAERSRAARVFEQAGVQMDAVDFVLARTNRSWARDYLPMWLGPSRPGARSGKAVAVKWHFNGWARYRDHLRDEAAGLAVGRKFAETLVRPRAGSEYLVLEGGAIDVDGRGTLLTTEECLLTGKRARLAALGRQGIEATLRDHLGIEQVVWMPAGIAGDDTSGHIDDFARFVAPGRVAICTETRRSDPNFEPLAAARRVLSRARDARGRRLEVVQLPMPRPLYFKGQRLPASYANFYIANGRVLVPTFNDPADRSALGVLEALFPNREVVGIHAVDLVVGLGTLHCSTMQQPRTAR